MAIDDMPEAPTGQELTGLGQIHAAALDGPAALLGAIATVYEGQARLERPLGQRFVAGNHGPDGDFDLRQRFEYQFSQPQWTLTVETTLPISAYGRDALLLATSFCIATVDAANQNRESASAQALMQRIALPDSAIHDRPAYPLVCLVAKVGSGMLISRDSAEQWSSAIRSRDPQALIAALEDQYICVMASDRTLGNDEFLRTSIATAGSAWGISSEFASWSETRAAYMQATIAATVGLAVHGLGSVSDVRRLGVYRLLDLIPEGEDLHSFLRDVLGDLADTSSSEFADLRRTLQVLLDTNLNIAETARQLHFHYNTVRYRLTKLTQLLGDFAQDPELRLAISLALRMVAMRQAASPGAAFDR